MYRSKQRFSCRRRGKTSSANRTKSVGLAGSDLDIGTDKNDIDNADEDDVQIFGGTSISPGEATHPRKKRALSLGPLDATHFLGRVSHDYSPPDNACDSSATSDDESDASGRPVDRTHSRQTSSASSKRASDPSAVSNTPALSHTYSTSASSSIVSLPLPSPLQASADQQNSSPQVAWFSPNASRSDKAIAALTLAMANGVGGINDYQAILALQGHSADESAEVGELWH